MSTITTAPLYVQFAQALRTEIARLGLPAPETHATPSSFYENGNWFFVEWGTHLAVPALIVPKSMTRMGNVHSHLDLSHLPGHIALPKKNGRVACHFAPDVSLISASLHLFIGASKRPVAPPVRRLVSTFQAASQATRVGSMDDLYSGLSPTSQPTTDYSEDDAEAAIQALNA